MWGRHPKVENTVTKSFHKKKKVFYSYINNNDDDVCKVRKNETFLAKRKTV